MLRWKFKQLLIKVALFVLALTIATTTIKAYQYTQPIEQPIRIVQQDSVITSSQFVISKEFVLGKLQSKAQIVSLEQELKNVSFTHIDDSWIGKRHTELKLTGTYKTGLETADIKVKHIDASGIVYIELPDPILISLELPYDQIEFDKTKGWLRLAMNEEEAKNFYSAAEKSIREDIMNNEATLKHAELFNQEAVRNIIKLLPTVKSVVFE